MASTRSFGRLPALPLLDWHHQEGTCRGGPHAPQVDEEDTETQATSHQETETVFCKQITLTAGRCSTSITACIKTS